MVKWLIGFKLSCFAFTMYGQSCETLGLYNIGPDLEITCVDSCLTLTAPQVADLVAGSTDYIVEAIEYNPPYAYSLGTVAINTGDDTYAPNIPIGFSFNFYGNNYTTCKIASNGFITFDQGETAPYNPNGSIPAASLPLNAIMAVYSDINPSTCGQIRYTTQGSAPGRKFVVNFDHVCQFSCTSEIVTSQIVLYEGSNAIEVYVDQRIPCSWGNATIGIQNQAGNSGLAAPGYNTGNWNANDVAWRWTCSQPAEGMTFWYEDEVFLGSGPSVDFCTSQTTTVTAEFGILAPGTFCEEYTVIVNSADSLEENNQIGWTLYTENGFPVVSESAPYNNSFCLANGCYTLDMTDSGNNGWGSASWSLELPDGTTIGPFSIESGGEATETFCLDSYTGPLPEIGDYEIVAEDDLDIIAVSDANAEFDYPGLICENSEPFQLVPVEGSGSWTVDCNGCFDEETLTIDPVAAGFGNLEVTHVLDGTCFADVFTDFLSIGNVPDINFASTTDTSLCSGETFDYNCTPPIGLWEASCGNCINSSGIFYTHISGVGEFEVTFTTFGSCPGSDTLIVSVSEIGEVSEIVVPTMVCENDTVMFGSEVPGLWSADCGGCLDQNSGIFDASDVQEGIYQVTFMPIDGCSMSAYDSIFVAQNCDLCQTSPSGGLFEDGYIAGYQIGLEECVASLDGATFCGEGTTWHEETGLCIPTSCLGDLNQDDWRGTGDLLLLLSLFQTSCQPETTEFLCGESMTYSGYNYSTVEIAGRCWFAENLRVLNYRNGDEIQGVFDGLLWADLISGAWTIGQDFNYLQSHGRLYNGYAVLDERGLCPNGWHIPTIQEFESLANDNSLQGFAEEAPLFDIVFGELLKSSPVDFPSWDGLNHIGFSALPSGFSHPSGFGVTSVGLAAFFWSSTEQSSESVLYGHLDSYGGIFDITSSSEKKSGFSVRCIQND